MLAVNLFPRLSAAMVKPLAGPGIRVSVVLGGLGEAWRKAMKGRPRSKLLERLRELGYELYYWVEPPSRPDYADLRFGDVLPCLSRHRIGSARLYRHQLEAYRALLDGRNVVLTAKTGSGKTEAWALAALARGWRVLAVYPTLALSADQIRRLEEYYEVCGYGREAVLRIDRPTLEKLRGGQLRVAVARARVVVTNPAFLLADLKRYALGAERSILADALRRLDLVVIDELDFYGPRSAHLLLAMLELISRYIAGEPPRVAVLSATLGNPGELASYISRVTGRETVMVEGKPFRVENLTMVVLAKNADVLRSFVLAHADLVAQRAKWVLDVVEDEEEFREHMYEVYEALEALGLRPPRPSLDPLEVLAEIVRMDGESYVTLVFTRSIRMAEKLYRSLLDTLPPRLRELVAIHHHLVPKRVREEVEDKARRGELRLIVTVRTLAQGIDIGTVARVVHVGLPLDLREFLQREGRKGRREDIQLSETIIIPAGTWDRKLLEAGSSTLREWLELPLEKVYLNPSNKYATLFKALWKLVAGLELDEEEQRLVLEKKLARTSVTVFGSKRLELTERGKRVWSEIGFYEHGPPYGYRKLVKGGELVALEEVSLRDLVERYQPGFYDPTTEMLVVSVDTRRMRILEEDVDEAVEKHSWLARAAARYDDVKRGWGEKPSLAEDMRYGRLQSIVELRVEAPLRGFGELVEEPVGVRWVVESRRPRLSRGRGGGVRVYREVASIELEAPVAGRYRDLTYGYATELPPTLDSYMAAIGLAMLQVLLRVHPDYALPMGMLRYRILAFGPLRLIHLWEYEAAGVLERIDWLEVAKKISEVKPTPLLAILVSAIDPEAGYRVLRGEVGLDQALAAARLVAEALAGVRVLEAKDVRILVPRRSREHKVAVVVAYAGESARGSLMGFNVFDGEDHRLELVEAESVGFQLAAALAQKLVMELDRLVTSGFTVYYYGRDQYVVLRRLAASSYMASLFVSELERRGALVDASRLMQSSELRATGLAATLGLDRMYELVRAGSSKPSRSQVEKALRMVSEAIYDLVLAARKGLAEKRAEERA
jgi:DEAD/DEAH box helicase domain-containing protein